jgi:hypothetical protein
MRRRLAITAAVLVVAAPGTALAVWGGTPDTAHPGVGAMYYDFEGTGMPVIDGLICSGSYAGESKDGTHDVFLLAGHCLPPPELGIGPDDLYVSFDNNVSGPGVSDPIQVEAFQQMPGFGHDFGDAHDLAVLLLPDDSVPAGVPAVELPPAGYLDALKTSGRLKFMLVDIVGYGTTPVWGPGGPTQFVSDGVRRSGTSVVTGLSKAWVRYNQNRNGIGTGSGVCFGDSGSPQFEAGTLRVLSVTSWGNGQCNANNSNYRVDTPQARAFLGQFVDLP